MAARLAEAGFRVLLLEAGGDPRKLQGGDPQGPDATRCRTTTTSPPSTRWPPRTRRCGGTSSSATTPTTSSSGATRSTAQRSPSATVDGVLYPRAGTLGGCTAHNAMIFVYPHDSDWNEIADITGDRSWRADHMRTYFERLENCRHRRSGAVPEQARARNPSRHGWCGWLPTEKAIPQRRSRTTTCAGRSSLGEGRAAAARRPARRPRPHREPATIRTTGASSPRAPSGYATRR